MRWLLVLLFPIQLLAQAQVLPPGVYKDLRTTKPIVLKKGSYTFIGLVFAPPHRGGWEGPWLDGRKADTARFYHCTFTGLEKGTILKMSGVVIVEGCVFEGKAPDQPTQGIDFLNGKRLMVRNCTFSNLCTALHFNAGGANNRHFSLTRNKFENNLTSIELTNGTIDFQLRCNEFITPNPTPTGQTRYGLRIGEDAELEGNRIGGNNENNTGQPNGNYWPRIDPTDIASSGMEGFISLDNTSPNIITYWAYQNEVLGNFDNSGSDGVFEIASPTQNTYYYNTQTLNAKCQLSGNNCGFASLAACRVGLLAGDQCGFTIPENTVWVPACPGAFVDTYTWPLPRPANSEPDSVLTKANSTQYKQEARLDQNVPNPGSETTRISYFLPLENGKAHIRISEVSTGRMVEIRKLEPGDGQIEINLKSYKSGVYAYQMISDKGELPKSLKLIVVK